MRIIRFADLTESPWKNGGGIARHVAMEQDDTGTLWQLSMAEITRPGPFSDYAGLTRILTVIEGGKMVLKTPDTDLNADFATPVRFDGATPVTSELQQGPVRAFNLLFDTARCGGTVKALRGPCQVSVGGLGLIGAIHCIAGTGKIGADTLGKGDTALLDNTDADVTLSPDDIALCVSIQPGG